MRLRLAAWLVPGKHVVQFFVQYAPYEVDPKYGNWADDGFKNAFADRVFSVSHAVNSTVYLNSYIFIMFQCLLSCP